jgi:hypothetical protein
MGRLLRWRHQAQAQVVAVPVSSKTSINAAALQFGNEFVSPGDVRNVIYALNKMTLQLY